MIESIQCPWSDLDPAWFLANFWQKKPVLIRGAFKLDHFSLTPDELAGLALEPEVDSRKITSRSEWTLEEGPFEESDLVGFPKTHATLLVQEVDQWIDAVFQFKTQFDFIPRWRTDDVMVSYATPEGSVGAHVDYYDVFLVQTLGTRRWKIELSKSQDESFNQSLPIRILNHFKPDTSFIVKPGDVVYLPPHHAHHGVALSEAMTWSVGFRSPSLASIQSILLEENLIPSLRKNLTEGDRYQDPHLKPRKFPNELLYEEDLRPILDEFSLESSLSDEEKQRLFISFGNLVSQSFREKTVALSRSAKVQATAKDIRHHLEKSPSWLIQANVRRFFSSLPNEVVLFQNGKSFHFDSKVCDWLIKYCDSDQFSLEFLTEILSTSTGLTLLTEILNENLLFQEESF